jgi:hypothetical protein
MRRIWYILFLGILVHVSSGQTSPHGAIKLACETCHSTDSWKMKKDASFQHSKTGFPIEGQHAGITCASCHKGLKFTGSSRQCTACHTDVHKAELGSNCTRCHSTQSWDISDMIQRHQNTRFPLLGRHAALHCEDCHANVAEHKYTGASLTCYGCHSTDYQNTKRPSHSLAGFGTDCEKCHKVNALNWGSGFDHSATAFPLTGVHATTSCISCHVNGVFANTSRDCYSCHQANYRATTSPNHAAAKFETNCVTCHTTSGWSPASFSHDNTKFPLTGSHKSVLCKDCHVNNQYATLPMNCVDCHRAEYAKTTNPDHQSLGYPQTCVQCHSTTAWKPAAFDHNATKFALTGKHIAVQCQDCHTNNNFQLVYTNCYPCHTTEYQRPTNPNHVTGMLDHRCETCHSTTGWLPSSFNHSSTKFALTGKHAAAQCQSCHVNGNYQLSYADCYQCHQADYARPASPVHVVPGFSHRCETCHTTSVWTPSTFDHNATKFSLTGAHRTVACKDCHTNNQYAGLQSNCIDCHRSEYVNTVTPNHQVLGYPQQCTQCHSTTAWKPAAFDHNATNFALTGKHLITQCQQCHIDNNYALKYTDCFPCHQTDFQRPTNPNHVVGMLDHRCETCHSTNAWLPSTFNHGATKFALTGKHATAQCQSCHVNGDFKLVYADCFQCHQADYAKPVSPAHVQPSFSHQCQTCHTTTTWTPSTFDHGTTKFVLTGSHRAAACKDCHKNNLYSGLPAACVDCHRTEYVNSTNPNHVSLGYPQTCVQCHSTTAWRPASFDHNTTKFALTGAHVATQCVQCHVNNNYQLVYTDCYPCHTGDYAKPINPNHVTGMLDHRCETCHSTTAWRPSSFNHSSTKFALTGTHSTTPCQSCHVNGNYKLAYTDCYMCHAADFAKPTSPNHVSAGFSHACETCHTTTLWKPATFNHGATKFALTGTHITTPCQSCHVNGNYQLVYTDCYACHSADFATPTNPNHVTAAFSHACETCHTTTVWKPSTFNHSATKFPLTGTHVTTPCQSCHVNGNYKLAYTDCYACHAGDFATPTNPNHVTAAFSHACETCHTTTVWKPSTFSHGATKFPLTGTHVTAPCQSCHVNGNYRLVYTDCYTCHASDFAAPTNPNHVSAGFSHACETCHTTTVWKPATFNHSTTKFALTGLHVTTPCQSCHTNGNYQLVYTDCYPCHSTDYARPTNPNHVTGMLDHRCESCHSTTAWLPSTFNHGTTRFTLTGTHLTTPCQSCHVNGNYKLSYTDCYACHSADFATPTNPNHVTAAFSHACETCHTTTVWKPSTFNHSSTKFALTGVHITTPCQSCHVNGNYQLVYNDCYQCHAADFAQPTNPNHVAGAFSHACLTCHTTSVWKPSTFSHATTRFPLTGAHAAVACNICHASNQYATLSTNCIDCHRTDYNGATNPNHATLGFPQTCTQCHTTVAWSPATFDHSTTKFPLTGLHTTTPCASCHTGGNYQLVYTSCYQCHASEYNATTNPVHSAAGFPTTCQTCHTTTTWAGATFNHTWFPQSHGNSGGVCAKCHTNATDYKVFSCTTAPCHPKATTDSHHQGRTGYVYNSANCYSCHPRGNN